MIRLSGEAEKNDESRKRQNGSEKNRGKKEQTLTRTKTLCHPSVHHHTPGIPNDSISFMKSSYAAETEGGPAAAGGRDTVEEAKDDDDVEETEDAKRGLRTTEEVDVEKKDEDEDDIVTSPTSGAIFGFIIPSSKR